MGIDRFSHDDFKSVIYDLPLYFEERRSGNEYVYYATVGHVEDIEVRLRILSSVSTKTNLARTDGDDAIRVHFVDAYKQPLALDGQRYKHIKRTGNWRDRLKDRVTDYKGNFPGNLDTCPECGRPMKLKGGFKGCTGWAPDDPDCDYTEDF